MTVKITVSGQIATKYNNPTLASGSYKFATYKLVLGDDWDGLTVKVQFSTDTITTPIEVQYNASSSNYIPYEVLASAGNLYVAIRGTKLDTDCQTVLTKATTTPLTYEIVASKVSDTVTAQ